MHIPQYALFYDFHTLPQIEHIGVHFNAEAFTARLAAAGVDYLVFHARCNMGAAYYNTAVGLRHPHLDFDLFGQLAEACRRKKIALCAYLNGGISHMEAIAHPEWEARPLQPRPYGANTPYARTMCYNSGFRDHLIAMAREIAANYPVAGFFFDCMEENSCACPRCVTLMQQEHLDWRDPSCVAAFSARSAARLAADLAAELKKINPEYLLYFNGVAFEEQSRSGTYLEFECIPTKGGPGYDYLQVMSRYMRTLGDKPLLNMTGRFYRWGDFGSLRSRTAIQSELLNGLANGLRPSIGDHMLPDGSFDTPALRQALDLYCELHKFDRWFENAAPVAEIAVVYPKTYRNIRFDAELYGAVRMLCELHMQFDVVTHASDWSHYRLLVFPDSVAFDRETTVRVRNYLAAGGKIIASGFSGLDADTRQIAVPESWGIEFDGECEFTPAYFEPGRDFAAGLPKMPLSIYAGGAAFRPTTARVAGWLIQPAVNFGWDGIYPCYYTPPGKKSDLPFLTITDQVAHFSHLIFTGYRTQGAPQLRTVFGNVLNRFLPEPLVRAPELPHFARLAVTRQPGRLMVHILAQIPEKRALNCEIIEDDLTIPEFTLEVRRDRIAVPTTIRLAPTGRKLDGNMAGQYLQIRVPQFAGYALIAIETKSGGSEPCAAAGIETAENTEKQPYEYVKNHQSSNRRKP